jgi:uncharacterized damage-inducible protein DinB
MGSAASTLLAEIDAETPATRRVLERVPADRLAWRPHPKSMSIAQLAQHVASIPGNAARLMAMDGFDVATAPVDYKPCDSRDALLATLDSSVAALRAALAGLDDAGAQAEWQLRLGDRVLFTWPRLGVVRTMGLNHWYHHRGELVVYLRLLDLPVPVVYGRSADENPFARSAA